MEAQLILGLCDRWHQVPSVVLAEDACRVLRMLQIEALAQLEGGE